jgi:hypothetical protein
MADPRLLLLAGEMVRGADRAAGSKQQAASRDAREDLAHGG